MCCSHDFITIILYKEPEHQPHHFFSGTEVSAQAGFLSPSSLNCLFSNMGPRVLLPLALGLVILTDCIQGVHETKKQSLVVSAFTDGSAVKELLTTARPVIQRQDKRPCTCKGKEMGVMNKACHCLNTGKWKKHCKKEKFKNMKICQRINKSFNPSVPI
ncbi:uncharacterized protein LOC143421096 [Maylandia zebra]|uniref:uncharacterized protein LOC143421096 n=1 Tax=Maylandia zebra TaxID=106582 RepID=UPI00403CD03D